MYIVFVFGSGRIDKIIPLSYVFTDEFSNDNCFYKIGYMYLTVMVKRCGMIGIFFLQEAVCISSGFGFNGYKNNRPMWDAIKCVNVFKYEFSINLDDVMKVYKNFML